MGVFDSALAVTGIGESDGETPPYVCLACDTPLEVQHHSCPECGGFDIRSTEWMHE